VSRGPLLVRERWLPVVRIAWLVFVIAAAVYALVVQQQLSPDMSFLEDEPTVEDDAPGFPSSQVLRQGLDQLGVSPSVLAWFFVGLSATSLAVNFSLALLLFRSRSNEVMALFVGVFLVASTCPEYPPDLVTMAETEPIRAAVGTVLTFTFFTSFVLLFLLFPDGRFAPRWMVVPGALFVAASAWSFFPTPERIGVATGALDALFLLVVLVAAISAQVYRYRRVSGPTEREQTKWFVYGLGVAMVGFIALNIFLDFAHLDRPDYPPQQAVIVMSLFQLLFSGVFLVAAVFLAVAMLRFHLFDIDLVINRTLVYSSLTACVVALYVLVVGGVGALLHTNRTTAVAFFATGVVAVAFQPLRDRLQRGVNRLLYGQRDDPYAVLAGLGHRLEGTLASDAILPAIVTAVTEALRLPYAAITMRQGDEQVLAAAAGTLGPVSVTLPLTYQGTEVGALHVAPRAGEELGAQDQRLLQDLARQAGVAVHAVRLTADLQRSRERIVTAREEERRRLRRDLHDGLGPRLAGLTLRIETARDRLAHDPDADELLGDLSQRMEDAVADIRRLVYGLRPPALDDLGLAGAIRQAAASYDASDIHIRVDVPDHLPALPAATEVAAFRIAQEALTNVVRHAGASRCAINLRFDDASKSLTLLVEDDGRGLSPERRNGVGLQSMRERAEELGGSLVVESRPGEGVRVQAELPCRRLDAETEG
jgi:signal transduction histidine kinase